MIKVALTGGIATGKSSVDKWLIENGYPVIDCDALVHESYETGGQLYTAVVETFGTKILNEAGTLDRRALSEIVFKDKTALEKLNQVTHPLVRQMVDVAVKSLFSKGNPLVFVDVPLLFEAGLQGDYDYSVLVYTSESLQLERLMLRNGYEREEAKRRILAQMPLEEKKALADYVLDNSKDKEALKEEVLTMLDWLKEKL